MCAQSMAPSLLGKQNYGCSALDGPTAQVL